MSFLRGAASEHRSNEAHAQATRWAGMAGRTWFMKYGVCIAVWPLDVRNCSPYWISAWLSSTPAPVRKYPRLPATSEPLPVSAIPAICTRARASGSARPIHGYAVGR